MATNGETILDDNKIIINVNINVDGEHGTINTTFNGQPYQSAKLPISVDGLTDVSNQSSYEIVNKNHK